MMPLLILWRVQSSLFTLWILQCWTIVLSGGVRSLLVPSSQSTFFRVSLPLGVESAWALICCLLQFLFFLLNPTRIVANRLNYSMSRRSVFKKIAMHISDLNIMWRQSYTCPIIRSDLSLQALWVTCLFALSPVSVRPPPLLPFCFSICSLDNMKLSVLLSALFLLISSLWCVSIRPNPESCPNHSELTVRITCPTWTSPSSDILHL